MRAEWKEQIEYIVTHFDADRVHTVMVALNWKWFDVVGIPEPHIIKLHLRELIESCISNMVDSGVGEYTVSTRGLSVTTNRYFDDDKLYIRASFNVTECNNCH